MLPDDLVEQTIHDVRDTFGPRFAAARREAEDDARALLDGRAGRMTHGEVLELGRLFNRHEVGGVLRYDRFTPAFTGYSIMRVAERIDELNEALSVFWNGSEGEALDLLDAVLRDRPRLRGAGSSLPSMLMYLHDPERFGVCINATIRGLRLATGSNRAYRPTGRDEYLRFCEDLQMWRKRWHLDPQEHDAVLVELMREDKHRSHVTPKPTEEPGRSTGAPPTKSSVAEIAAFCYLPVETVEEWTTSLTDGRLRQAFFHGPPGTGKTHVATHVAHHLATSPAHVRVVQFHPAYSYEDFVEGLRPEVVPASGLLTYAVRPGLFRELCAEAAAAPDERFVLVVDEMNRADLAAVFGELLLLLEYRGRTVQLPYSHKSFCVPDNVFLLGTMNTADRSLALVDFALRRRFHAFPLAPDRDVLRSWLAGQDDASDLPLRVFKLVTERVGADPATPGHSYWMDSADAATLLRTWSFQVRPYLAELWFDQPDRLESLHRDVLTLLGEGS